MSKFSKLATCLFIALAGIVGYFIYLSTDASANIDLSLEVINGDEEVLNDLNFYAMVTTQTPYSDHSFRIESGEVQSLKATSFFKDLDSAGWNPAINYLRFNHKSFMRDKGLNLEILETDETFYTANIEGDFLYQTEESRLVLAILDKETAVSKEYMHDFNLTKDGYSSVWKIYTDDQTAWVLTRHVEYANYNDHVNSSIDESNNYYSITQFDLNSGESTHNNVNLDFEIFDDFSHDNSPFAIVYEIDEEDIPNDDWFHYADDPYYGMSEVTEFSYLDLRTGEVSPLPTIENLDTEDDIHFTSTDQDIYALAIQYSENTIKVYKYNDAGEEWSDELTIPVEFDLSDPVFQYSDNETGMWVDTPIIQFSNWKNKLVISLVPDYKRVGFIQINDLEKGELSLSAEVDVQGSDTYEYVLLSLLNFY